jgi:TPR repeat protein
MVDISDLTLLRNDPAVVEKFVREANAGDIDAQYGLGLIYAEGRGVPQDDATAFYWLTRAVEQGDRDAETLRNHVAVGMSSDQFERADLMMKQYRGMLVYRSGTDASPGNGKPRH